ncbi:MAG: DUF4423 domain-containing protein [Polyangiaceae bacterium]
MNYESLSSELLRALRGKRSQTAFSKRLGYRSNVAYAWESGRAWPTALDFFGILERSGRKLEPALAAFFRVPAGATSASVKADLKSAPGIAAFLDDLRGQTPVVDLARSAKRSRFAVARWLKGEAEPRLPDFLRLVECASLRVLDFLACFIDPNMLPSAAKIWRELETARRAAYEMPWSHAVLRVIELPAYRKLRAHEPGFIAERLGISRAEEERCIALLLETGQLKKQAKRLIPGAALTVDTRGDAARSRQAKVFWTQVALERIDSGALGTFSYNLFSVSRADLERIRELHRAYFRELRRIVAASEPAECIALANVHLLELGAGSA